MSTSSFNFESIPFGEAAFETAEEAEAARRGRPPARPARGRPQQRAKPPAPRPGRAMARARPSPRPRWPRPWGYPPVSYPAIPFPVAEPLLAPPTRCDCPPPADAAAEPDDTPDQGEFGAFEYEDNTEHEMSCRCPQCGGVQSEAGLSEADEIALAGELLSVASEEELEEFLGKLVKGAWKGLKKVGSAVGKIAKPLGGALKGLAKKALPFVGGALGSFIPIPGVGTALGSALGSAVGNALEMEFAELEEEDREFEMARRFVRIASSAAKQAATAAGSGTAPQAAVGRALAQAVRQHLPAMASTASTASTTQGGRWTRQGDRITLMDA
jgi:hypothetical protein